MKKIVLTGGGTAGHVTPNIALIPALLEKGYEISYIGSYDGMERKLIEDYKIPYYGIATGKFRRYFDPKNFTDPFRVIKGIGEARKILKEIDPDIVFSKGGFVAVPVVRGAYHLHIPVISHESAAFIHGLLSGRPVKLSVTLNTGINPSRLTESGIKVYTVKEDLLNLGKSEISNEYGRSVSIYNIERTVCDIIRSRNKLNDDILSGVLKAYVKRSDRDLVKLMLYAKSFTIRNIVREYLEILL